MINERIYNLESLIVCAGSDFLKIRLSGKAERKRFLLEIIMLLLLVGVIFFLPKPQAVKLSFLDIVIIIFLILIICIIYFNSLIKSLKCLRENKFTQNSDTVIINGRVLCDKCISRRVIIQPKISIYGFGLGYTVGVGFDRRKYPIIFAVSQNESIEVSKIIADFLKCDIEKRKPIAFSFITKW